MCDRWRTGDARERQGIVVSGCSRGAPSTGPPCLLATRVINGSLLATTWTRLCSDTDMESYLIMTLADDWLTHTYTLASADLGGVNQFVVLT